MKKAVIVIVAVAAVIMAVSIAAKSFAFGVSVPKSVSDVTRAPSDIAYDACKAWANERQNNMSYNSDNIESQMKGKEFSDIIYEKDYRKGGSKYDVENKRLEMRATYNNLAEVKVRCSKEKCNSIYCSRK